ncbi:Tellurite resistance protein TerB [Methanocella sp. CWC-04]|uniref:Tellurite resistance protein TerB n=1 Tax=Methanooceanicella nereidis TaxID=2052831 RepID=A0AAP2RB08_9EURY|nr:tellurite resistance TerB family protein [Methanocella sp. CWC-04]MCD1294241.1 Tellurite resistance protein TerB [Methanocella sp. CWC-04]
MGLFDKVFGGNQPAKLTAPEAFTGVVLAAVASDGSISQEEGVGVISALSRMKMYRGYNEPQMKNLLEKAANTLKKQGPGAIMIAAKETLNQELRESAFAVAADLILADGVVEDEEKKFLDELQKVLGVPDDLALKIAEVMVIKNRG